MKTRIAKTEILGVALSVAMLGSAKSEVRMTNLFTDHMILQQETSNAVWGFAEVGEEVTVKASWGAEASAVADEAGDWKVFLETPSHGTGYSLTTEGSNTIEIKDVAIGEVWLCAGQSNMGWKVGSTFGGEAEAAAANAPHFRIFRASREHWHEPLKEPRDLLSRWQPCTPQSAEAASAVSYYFGKKLHEELDVPVGIIIQAFAGTPIEGWMPWEIQSGDPRAQAHKASYDANGKRMAEKMGVTEEKALAEHQAQLSEYQELVAKGETMLNAVKPLSPPIITKPAQLGHQYPAHQYNAMIYPVRPYGIRGMIWYQGERNAKNAPQAFHYRNQLPLMIEHYRKTWHEQSGGHVDRNFPFQFTQLPSWNPAQTEPVEGLEASWAVSRESMLYVTHHLENTAMSVSIDTGDAIQLHPKNKKPIGLRHAYLALEKTYGKAVVGNGPRYKSYEVKGDKVVLQFDPESIGGGLKGARSGALDAFAVAGADQVWHWAEGVIVGDRVEVKSDKVSTPVAVRYAWAMNPSQRNLLYNAEGIPASPFRTDDWALFDPQDELVEVLKPAKPEGYEDKDWDRPAMTQ